MSRFSNQSVQIEEKESQTKRYTQQQQQQHTNNHKHQTNEDKNLWRKSETRVTP